VLALLVALAGVPALGCQATTLTAHGAPVPVLIGPVACIGCAPGVPVGPVLAPIEDRALARNMAGGSNAMWEKTRPNFARKIAAVVRNPCRVDVHVSQLRAGAVGVFALFFGMTSVDVQVTATANLVANGTCKMSP
jgi:hypothetical protein